MLAFEQDYTQGYSNQRWDICLYEMLYTPESFLLLGWDRDNTLFVLCRHHANLPSACLQSSHK